MSALTDLIDRILGIAGPQPQPVPIPVRTSDRRGPRR